MNLKFLILIVFLFLIQFGSSYNFIYGQVNDALDGEFANGHSIIVWNPVNGMDDNLTDVIGPSGASYSDNHYMVDCDSLNTPCSVGDILSVKVLNSGDDYLSDIKTINVTGAGYDVVSNITLNSIPAAFTNSPLANSFNQANISFNCSFKDWDVHSGNLTLFGNWSGQWQVEGVENVSAGDESFIFSKLLNEGTYFYACRATDNLSVSSFSENITFHVDPVPPKINYFNLNESSFCGNKRIQLICNAEDVWNLSEVLIQVENPSSIANYSTINNFGNYSLDLNVNESGFWNFTCFAIDSAENINFSRIEIVSYSNLVDVVINNVSFDVEDPFEGQNVLVNATVKNSGCIGTGVFSVGFYLGNPFEGGIKIGEEQNISLDNFSEGYVDINYFAKIGNSNIFVYADNGSVLNESNESNNVGNNSLYVSYWQNFYGNLSIIKSLNFQLEEFSNWSIEDSLTGNVFIADSEGDISWNNLKAIGKFSNNSFSEDDFADLDILLGMNNTPDAFSTTYALNGFAKNPINFTVHKNFIYDVPTINSTDNANFITGILWDSSDDSNGGFDVLEKEDLIFVARINKSSVGKYGVYDYEIKIPAKLREYDEANVQEVYFYFELN